MASKILGNFCSLSFCLLFCVSAKAIPVFTDPSSVSPASSPEVWGFEIGVIASRTNDLLGRLTFPHALTLEAMGIPQNSVNGDSVAQWGAALQWTFTDEFLISNVVDMALKAKYGQGQISNADIISNESLYGFDFLVSRIMGIFEPYLSFGYAKANDQEHPESWQGSAGFNLYPTPFLIIGAECTRSFNVDYCLAKLSFQMD